jgi:hypothetical protein
MKKLINFLAVLTLPLALAVDSAEFSPDDYAEAKAYIVECATDWANTVVTGDMSKRKVYFAKDFKGTGVGGSRYGYDEVTSGTASTTIRSNEIGPIDVRFFGATAIAYGEETFTTVEGSQGKFIWTDIWMYRDGEWQIVAAQDVEIDLQDASGT